MTKAGDITSGFVQTVAALGVCLVAAAPPCRGGQAAFGVIYNNQGYPNPQGLVEGSPGVFYYTAGSAGPTGYFSVTLDGKRTTLGAPATGSFFSAYAVSGPDQRFYASVCNSPTQTCGLFSVASAPGGQRLSTQSAPCSPDQNLPDGAFLGLGTGPSHELGFAHCDTDGTVSYIALMPGAGNVMDSDIYAQDGNYYGVLLNGAGIGSVVQATPSGAVTALYTLPSNTFTKGGAGTPILMGTDGNLYGSISTGGANGTGMVYKLTLSGQFTLLHSFEKGKYVSGPSDLIQASDGNLYGDMQSGSDSRVFRITTSGQYTELTGLYSMGCYCLLLQGSDGIIYGLASSGGTAGYGGIFAIDAGLPKPTPQALKFAPQRGPVGTRVRIWGYNLLRASVQFGSQPGDDVVNSGPNYVWVTVPAGASSGPITVTTPGGTAVTVASFKVE